MKTAILNIKHSAGSMWKLTFQAGASAAVATAIFTPLLTIQTAFLRGGEQGLNYLKDLPEHLFDLIMGGVLAFPIALAVLLLGITPLLLLFQKEIAGKRPGIILLVLLIGIVMLNAWAWTQGIDAEISGTTLLHSTLQPHLVPCAVICQTIGTLFSFSLFRSKLINL